MVRSVTHDMLPQATANEVSRQQFIVALKQGLNRGLRSSQAALFDNVVAPAYEAEHGHPPRHREEIRAAMQAEPAYQTWSALARAAQEQMWVAVGDSVFRDRFRLARRAAELDSSPQRLGSLTLNPDFEPPRGVTAVDIHLQTGGYALDLLRREPFSTGRASFSTFDRLAKIDVDLPPTARRNLLSRILTD
jgi:hypothetical protein